MHSKASKLQAKYNAFVIRRRRNLNIIALLIIIHYLDMLQIDRRYRTLLFNSDYIFGIYIYAAQIR